MQLTPETINLVAVHILRCPIVTNQFLAAGITPDEIRHTSFEHISIMWGGILMYRSQQQTDAPSHFIMADLCSRYLHQSSAAMETVYNLRDFLTFAYGIPEADLRPEFVIQPAGLLQQYIDSIKVAPMWRAAALNNDPSKLPEAFNKLAETYNSTRVSAAQYVDIFDPENMKRLTAMSLVEPTDVEFIDYAIGGLPKVACVGVLAMPGGGKTMLGTQWVSEYVLRGRNAAVFHYEQCLEGDIVERFYSYMSSATRKDLVGGYENYSPAVLAAIANIRPMTQRHLRIFPMAGDINGQGMSGPDEMLGILNSVRHTSGWEPELVLIDWLEPIVMGWTAQRRPGLDNREQLKFTMGRIKSIMDHCKCQVVILHQLQSEKASKMTPNVTPTHFDAAELKGFGQLVTHALAFGAKDPMTDCMLAHFSKARGAKSNVTRVVQMDAQANKIRDAADYELNKDAGYDDKGYFLNKHMSSASSVREERRA